MWQFPFSECLLSIGIVTYNTYLNNTYLKVQKTHKNQDDKYSVTKITHEGLALLEPVCVSGAKGLILKSVGSEATGNKEEGFPSPGLTWWWWWCGLGGEGEGRDTSGKSEPESARQGPWWWPIQSPRKRCWVHLENHLGQDWGPKEKTCHTKYWETRSWTRNMWKGMQVWERRFWTPTLELKVEVR